MVVWARPMPRSAIIWTRSPELSLKVRYHLTHRTIISWSKWRPLNRSHVGSVILAVTAARRGFQVCTRTELWTLIRDAVNAGKGIVTPYAGAADDGAPAWRSTKGPDGFAHWCL